MNLREKRLAVELFQRLKERTEQNKRRAELDLRILEKWRKDFLVLQKHKLK